MPGSPAAGISASLEAERRRSGDARSHVRRRTTAHDVAICLSVAPGLAHLIGTREHLDWWFASGIFFAVLAVLQLVFAALMLRGCRNVAVLVAGVWLNAGVAVVYLLSRTVGLPGQPPIATHGRWEPGRSIIPGAVEPVRTFDLLILVAELALIVVMCGLLPPRSRRLTLNLLMGAGVVLWALTLSGRLS